VELVVRRLVGCGWRATVEYTFSLNGGIGSVDVLAWHVPSRALLVIEVNASLLDLQETLSTFDRKVRAVRATALTTSDGGRPPRLPCLCWPTIRPFETPSPGARASSRRHSRPERWKCADGWRILTVHSAVSGSCRTPAPLATEPLATEPLAPCGYNSRRRSIRTPIASVATAQAAHHASHGSGGGVPAKKG